MLGVLKCGCTQFYGFTFFYKDAKIVCETFFVARISNSEQHLNFSAFATVRVPLLLYSASSSTMIVQTLGNQIK